MSTFGWLIVAFLVVANARNRPASPSLLPDKPSSVD